jgi:hypothetical protein
MSKYRVPLVAVLLTGCSTTPPLGPIQFTKSSQTFTARLTPRIGLGDFDGDGDLDAVFATMGLQHSQLLMNDGTGHFIDSGQELTQQGHGVGVGDLDGDGDLDLFVTCAGWNDGETEYNKPSKIYFNDGSGRFRDSGQDLGDTYASGTTADLFDFDSDGDLDAHVQYYPRRDKIYLNDGRGHFAEADYAIPESVTWGDLDSDGDPDMFMRVPGVGFRVALNDGDGQDLDVVVTNGLREAGYPTTLLLNDGTGRFVASDQTLTPVTMGRAGLGDLDGDGDVDILLTSAGEPHVIWLNDGKARFVDSEIRLENLGAIHNPVIQDLDNDGRADIIIAHFSPDDGTNEIWFNQTENHPTHRSQPAQRETSSPR